MNSLVVRKAQEKAAEFRLKAQIEYVDADIKKQVEEQKQKQAEEAKKQAEGLKKLPSRSRRRSRPSSSVRRFILAVSASGRLI